MRLRPTGRSASAAVYLPTAIASVLPLAGDAGGESVLPPPVVAVPVLVLVLVALVAGAFVTEAVEAQSNA
jgi:hypothetical protein